MLNVNYINAMLVKSDIEKKEFEEAEKRVFGRGKRQTMQQKVPSSKR